MSNRTDPELCSLIITVCKPAPPPPPKILTSQKLCSPLCSFGLKSFHGFFILVGRIEPTTWLVFYLVIKMWENPYKKPYQTRKTVKTCKKHQNVLTGTYKIRQILFHRFVGEYTLFLPIPLLFWRREWKLGKLGWRGDHFLKNSSRGKGKRDK